MISELDRKILTKVCGMCWHTTTGYSICGNKQCSCGALNCQEVNPTFTTPDDWEMVRVKVVVPNGKYFSDFTWDRWICDWEDTDMEDFFSWWNTKTPEEQCQIAADFIKSRPGLFPWVEMMGKEKV